MQLEKVYEPQRFEPHWAQWWIDNGVFLAHVDRPGPVFSLAIPPPNVTGSLHMGHMLDHSEMDLVIRWHRMVGDNTLWLPGTDHAGIATQMVVERELAKQGLTRQDLGREAFDKRVWEWKEECGGIIVRQMKRIGDSCDWSRERFTFDPGLSRAVRETFVRLYERGLIYRGEYMVNWCPRCHTALSDLEVNHEETQGSLWHIRYPVLGTDRFVVVATTRPETMLGDTAVAINPGDERYKDFHGRNVLLPLMKREIPIILDPLADPKFGTGAVKVTPAHDPNDFEAGKRHNLPRVEVIGLDGSMTPQAGAYAGLDRFEARKKVLEDLRDQGLLEKTEPYALAIGGCQRCKTVVEPLVSTQWFVKMKPLAEPAIQAVEDGRIQFIPDNWAKTYFEWMRNIRDWCISRQLWWGHRIPAWHCQDCKKVSVAREAPAHCEACGSSKLEQDPDVLDTWFSSGLWPFSTLGWPDETADLKRYYPTSVLITAYDIIFFWVARMIVMGLECTGEVPFRKVYIHGLVRDGHGHKMSKTRGNVIDPLAVTEKYGTDAVRMSLIMAAAPGMDVVAGEDRMEASRSFANKIWNAARFVFMNMERSGVEPWAPEPRTAYRPEAVNGAVPLEDRWIFSRLNRHARDVNRAIEQYRFHEAGQLMWEFVWHEFCDWYVEVKKLRFEEKSGLNGHWRNILTVFESALRLLHPAMPFLTEEVWQRLVVRKDGHPASIALAKYPRYDPAAEDAEAERQMELVRQVIVEARALRADAKLDPKTRFEAVVVAEGEMAALALSQVEAIEKLANVKLSVAAPGSVKAEGLHRQTKDFDILLKVSGSQLGAQRTRLEKEIQQLEKVIAGSERQLSNEEFLRKAPPRVLDSLRAKLIDYQAQLVKSRATLEGLTQ